MSQIFLGEIQIYYNLGLFIIPKINLILLKNISVIYLIIIVGNGLIAI